MIQMDFTMTGDADEVIEAKNEVIDKILEMWGQYAEGAAKENITAARRVKTGALRNSISHQVESSEEAVYIGSNLEYAVYNEVGTGREYPGGRQTPWAYKDKDGNVFWTTGMVGIHFLEKAISEHTEEYNAMAQQELQSGS